MGHQLTLMNRARITRCIKRMAIQAYERFPGNLPLHIIGLNERGFALAKELVNELVELRPTQDNIIHNLDVFSKGSQAIPDLNDQQVIIVDDVVFSGRTLFQALSVLFHSQEPEAIEIVSLIDRGHRRYPVLANIVGEHIPTKVGEHVEVLLNGDHLETVVLFKNS
jgi:pyrimidine operon attenuation protein/uracil phosphoribosyltransferase